MLSIQGLNVYEKVVAILVAWTYKCHQNTHRYLYSLGDSQRNRDRWGKKGRHEKRGESVKKSHGIWIFFFIRPNE